MEIDIKGTLIWITIILFLFLYHQLKARYNFWKERNVQGPKPTLIFGNSKNLILGRISIAQFFKKYYDNYKSEPYVGLYDRTTPMLLLKDPDFIKDVLIKDFNYFPNRGLSRKRSLDPFAENLANLEYDQWRFLRTNLTSAFSSARLKHMFYLIAEIAQCFESYTEKLVKKNEPIECRELTAKYTTDSIGVCVFGLNMNSLGDEISAFRKFGRDYLDPNLKNIIRQFLRDWMPWVYSILSPLIYNRAVNFFIESMKETMAHRRENNVRRNDFVDLLMDLRDLSEEELNNTEMTDMFLISQAYIFFLAGFETSSITITNALYELALHPLYQDKLREEIREVFAKDGKLTYKNVKTLKYLDQVVKETLRKYPPVTMLRRLSVSPYTFRSTKLHIPKNTLVIIPVWAIHRDPNIWPEPDAFDPERFNDINEQTRHPMNYLPFGDGPHNCIGYRFADYQTKMGIATLINKFRVDVCEKTCIPYPMNPRGIITKPIGGIYLNFTKC